VPPDLTRQPFLATPPGGRTWWAHHEFTRINIDRIILSNQIEEFLNVADRIWRGAEQQGCLGDESPDRRLSWVGETATGVIRVPGGHQLHLRFFIPRYAVMAFLAYSVGTDSIGSSAKHERTSPR
jgi:hypothetical protein